MDNPVNVLDCGCGYAHFAPMLMKYLSEGSSYAGIDFSSSLTEQAEKLLGKYNINGKILKGDFLESNFRDKYDIVTDTAKTLIQTALCGKLIPAVDCRKNRWII